MSSDKVFRLGPDIPGQDELRDDHGRLVDDRYVEQATTDALRQVRGRGRPSLSRAGESPLLRVRISRELDDAVNTAAQNSGESRSEWVRRVLDDAAHRAAG